MHVFRDPCWAKKVYRIKTSFYPSPHNFKTGLYQSWNTSISAAKQAVQGSTEEMVNPRHHIYIFIPGYCTHTLCVCLSLLLNSNLTCCCFICCFADPLQTNSVQFVPKCCLVIEFMQYKRVSVPQENVNSVQFVNVSSVSDWVLPLRHHLEPTNVHAVDNKSW